MASPVVLPAYKWKASPNFSKRDPKVPVDMIVIHDTEGGYEGSISWFANPKSQVSAHLVVREDGLEATQMVAYAKKAWHASAYNSRAIGVEMAGFKARGFSDSEWRHVARITAWLCKKYGIPPRWSRGVRSGIARHADLGAAGGGHTDPTENIAKWLWFIGWVKYEYNRGGFNPDWGSSL